MGQHPDDALTANFRLTYIERAHDVLLKTIKTATYEYAKETERREEEDRYPNEDLPAHSQGYMGTDQGLWRPLKGISADIDEFREYKEIKTLERERRADESNENYIK